MRLNQQKSELNKLAIEVANVSTSYYPILKAKRGELKSLELLSLETKTSTIPIIELIPNSGNNVKKYIIENWSFEGNKILIDPYILLTHSSNGFREFKEIYNSLASSGVNVIPVLRIKYSNDTLEYFRKLINGATPIAIRINNDHPIIKNPQGDINRIKNLFTYNEDDISLIIDYSYVDEDNVISTVSSISTILKSIEKNEYLNVIVACGSFIKDLSSIPTDSIKNMARQEWIIWKNLTCDDNVTTTISYGDYATRHPIYEDTTQSFPGSSSIRYTGENDFVIFRGILPGNHPDGMGQYHDKCAQLIRNPNYDGVIFSEADRLINDCAKKLITSGNPESWVKISTARHIEKIVSLLN
ncbi:hypothetical protein GCM10023149_34320 [Mucilaginibacter gynuensis]|uniref:Beta protein n=1 Tax=Mucilaginibacter gynuensis TaxID=1302236 RepID=A0ABP8GT77_9SPHI